MSRIKSPWLASDSWFASVRLHHAVRFLRSCILWTPRVSTTPTPKTRLLVRMLFTIAFPQMVAFGFLAGLLIPDPIFFLYLCCAVLRTVLGCLSSFGCGMCSMRRLGSTLKEKCVSLNGSPSQLICAHKQASVFCCHQQRSTAVASIGACRRRLSRQNVHPGQVSQQQQLDLMESVVSPRIWYAV